MMPDPNHAQPLLEENCISPEMVEVVRNMTPSERLEVGFGMWRSARRLTTAAVRHQHPDWNEGKVKREVARRLSHGYG